ncbi:MAG: SDR family NAD(P)-dependent oxidoreductase [Phycisphaeraceae bacterium]
MSGELAGRVIIITGASAGIGKATALAAAAAKMRVVLAARRLDRLEELASQCEQKGAQGVLAVATDVSVDADVQQLVTQAVELFGRIDVMLANAGLGHFGPLLETDSQTQRRLWEVNYHGSIRCARAAAEMMRTQRDAGWGKGHIMLTSSVVGRVGLPYYGEYAATKAAQHAAAAGLRMELEPEDIRVTCIYPGGTATEFFDVIADGAGAEALAENTPRIFMQTPEQVAGKILRGIRKPRPELWPSWITWLGMMLWTLSPGLYTLSFRGHARRCRKELARLAEQRRG